MAAARRNASAWTAVWEAPVRRPFVRVAVAVCFGVMAIALCR